MSATDEVLAVNTPESADMKQLDMKKSATFVDYDSEATETSFDAGGPENEGELKREIRALTVRLLEKEMEIQNIVSSSKAKEKNLKEHLQTSMQFTSLRLAKEQSLTEGQRTLLAEAVQLRRILADYRLAITFERNEVQSHSMDDIFLIGRSDCELLQTIPWERLTLLDLLKFRVFQLAATVQECKSVWQAKEEASTQTVEEIPVQSPLNKIPCPGCAIRAESVVAEESHIAAAPPPKNEKDWAISGERQLSLLKADNEYLSKQVLLEAIGSAQANWQFLFIGDKNKMRVK
ncbi:unnamed protein product [Dibothriocephalus latus]|uniref:Uncharacterized protein n=1 Tax=Dibothriocephalus latus TaxID=60516 RepID=A0A3P7LRF6_DIBLA|nr:unnamed protein product [Dibothriocephalus latus]